MQLEIKGQVYVLAMLPDGDLGLFAPTHAGLKRLPIYNDGEQAEEYVGIPSEDDEGRTVVN